MMEINVFLEHKEKDTSNVVQVKNLYKAMTAGDVVALREILSDNPTWHVCPGTPEGGTYRGMKEVFGIFYASVGKILHNLRAEPEVFVDGGDIVVVLGFYCFTNRKGDVAKRVRFSHTWKITADNRIDGVWQVCDSHDMREFIEANAD